MTFFDKPTRSSYDYAIFNRREENMKTIKIVLLVLLMFALAPLAALSQTPENDVYLTNSDEGSQTWQWSGFAPFEVLRFIFHCNDATELKISIKNYGTEGMKWRATAYLFGKTVSKKMVTASGKYNVYSNPVVLKTGGISPLWAVVEVRYFGGPVSYSSGTGMIKFETNGASAQIMQSGYPKYADY